MTMKIAPLRPTDLDQFAADGFPDDYPADRRTFYAPVDNVHGALLAVARSARHSLAIAMFGFDDDDLADVIKRKLDDEHVRVTLTFDSSQAGGVHERAILAREAYPASIIAVGRSEKHAIMHMKLLVADGLIVANGSTNWSDSGESKQDNQLTVTWGRPEAFLARVRIDTIHAAMLAATHRKASH